MPIEDVDYLKSQSIKQSYVFLVDSKDRDRAAYPTPSDYVVRFDTPFLNVVGLEVLEATIPRTMYNIDVANNSIKFCIYADGFSGEKTFVTKSVPIGDYSIQTLIPALNTAMQMNVLGTNITASIVVSSLSTPPDVRNTLVFTCPYPFILDMQESSIAESLGFDLYTSISEQNTPIETRRYSVPAGGGLQGNPRLYASVDRPWPAIGPSTMIFEGPRGVLRSEPVSQTSWVAQKWQAPYDGYLSGLDVAVTTTSKELMDEGIVWALHEHNSSIDAPGGIVLNATNMLAISVVDGGFSDATMPSAAVPIVGGRHYWIVLKNDDTKPVSVFFNDVIATETTFKRSANGATGPWTPVADAAGVFYNMSARIYVAQAYHRIEAPGVISLVGERYVTLRCPEIEDNMVRSLSYGRMGLAKMRLGVMGVSENRVDFNKIALREFHPIGKLSRMTLRFERGDGKLYDFKGVNHTIVFALHYYEPVQKAHFERSILNPNYNGNFHEYMYREDEREEDSDDQSVDYNEDYDTFNKWQAMQQRNLPEQRHMQDIEALKDLRKLKEYEGRGNDYDNEYENEYETNEYNENEEATDDAEDGEVDEDTEEAYETDSGDGELTYTSDRRRTNNYTLEHLKRRVINAKTI